jgi:hypothetical protein
MIFGLEVVNQVNRDLSETVLVFRVEYMSQCSWVRIPLSKAKSRWYCYTYISKLVKLISWHGYSGKLIFNGRRYVTFWNAVCQLRLKCNVLFWSLRQGYETGVDKNEKVYFVLSAVL